MRHPEPLVPTPEPSVRENSAPVFESVQSFDTKSKASKIKNYPSQAYQQQARKLVNDQELLKELRTKLGVHSVRSEPESESESESEPEPEISVLNHASDDAESMTSAPLLFLPAKIKNTEVHFMIDSGATNNFLSHALVRQLDLPTTRLKTPIHISFADGRTQSIQRYCLVRVPFDPRYQPLLKFYVADIAHDAYLGQPWLTSDSIGIDWSSGNVRTRSDITIRGIRKKERQLSLMSTCQFKKAMKNDQAFLCVVRPQEPENKNNPPPVDPRVQDLLNEYADVFPDELPKELPPERTVDHRIDLLPNSAPVSKPTYKMSLVEMDELRRQLDDLLSRGFIRPSSSPYGSPVLFVKKKEGDLRLCIDY